MVLVTDHTGHIHDHFVGHGTRRPGRVAFMYKGVMAMEAFYSVYVRNTPYIICDGFRHTKQNVTAIPGLVRVHGFSDGFFGGPESKDYRSKVMLNPSLPPLLPRRLQGIANREGSARSGGDSDRIDHGLLISRS